ncbi:MAG: 2-phospho-L-lactate guanylyltransferase [Actinomycetota bacterium]|nr:2-phospho-L-lactate guanylyltransferase [Actinomycetota bacterium]
MRWTVVIPAKSFPEAKSRLAPMSADAHAHRRLVEAIRSDTITAACGAGPVTRVLVVVDRADAIGAADVEWLVQTRPGLNAAVAEAAAFAARSWPDDGIAALVGDLPGLRPGELAETLDAAAAQPLSFVADAAGTGTTLLAAVPGTVLRPEFGAGSAARHAVRATAIAAGPGLRHDVDTADDLHDTAAHIGVGAATGAVLTDLGVTVRSTCLGMIGP